MHDSFFPLFVHLFAIIKDENSFRQRRSGRKRSPDGCKFLSDIDVPDGAPWRGCARVSLFHVWGRKDKMWPASPTLSYWFFSFSSLLINALNDDNQSRKRKIYSPILILLGIDWGLSSITPINAFRGAVLSCLTIKTSRSSFISTLLLHFKT